MKISALRTHVVDAFRANFVFVVLETDAGIKLKERFPAWKSEVDAGTVDTFGSSFFRVSSFGRF